jgi:hypothetical protein
LGVIRQLANGKTDLGKIVFGGSARYICANDSEILNRAVDQFVREHMREYFLDVMFEGKLLLVEYHSVFESIAYT